MIGGPSYYSPDEGGEPCPDCNVPQIGEDAANGAIGEREAWLEDLKRIAHELRTYNPAADEYKGEHIHKVWAREIEALLPAASNGEPK
jgi:hypothetical protein